MQETRSSSESRNTKCTDAAMQETQSHGAETIQGMASEHRLKQFYSFTKAFGERLCLSCRALSFALHRSFARTLARPFGWSFCRSLQLEHNCDQLVRTTLCPASVAFGSSDASEALTSWLSGASVAFASVASSAFGASSAFASGAACNSTQAHAELINPKLKGVCKHQLCLLHLWRCLCH